LRPGGLAGTLDGSEAGKAWSVGLFMTTSISMRSRWVGAVAGAAMLGATPGLAADLAAAPKVLPAPAAAASVPIDFVFGARVQSDYNFRGISQSDRKPSLQGYGEFQLFDNLLYAGVAAYQVDLPTKPLAEVDITFGVRPKWGAFTFDFGGIYYYYPQETRLFFQRAAVTPKDTDFFELVGKGSYNFQDRVIAGAGVFHSWDYLGSGANGTYVNSTLKVNIPDTILPSGFAVSGELGHYFLGRTDASLGSVNLKDYTYWNVGGSYTYKFITIDLRYHDTNLSEKNCFINTTDPGGLRSGRSKWCGQAFIATLAVDLTASQIPGVFTQK
jgi:uncharacterized protein (TIGR02001 family)